MDPDGTRHLLMDFVVVIFSEDLLRNYFSIPLTVMSAGIQTTALFNRFIYRLLLTMSFLFYGMRLYPY